MLLVVSATRGVVGTKRTWLLFPRLHESSQIAFKSVGDITLSFLGQDNVRVREEERFFSYTIFWEKLEMENERSLIGRTDG